LTAPSLFPDYRPLLLPRILSSIDRDPFSKTRGCADRRYWAWKTVDFPDATFSRLALLLHKMDPAACRDPIDFIFAYLARIQHRDGSFDQAFPNEHSHGAAAFLLADLAEICSGNAELFNRHRKMLERMGGYLIRYGEGHDFISNHLAGAALGLFRLSELTGDAASRKRAVEYQNLILKKQSPEGWYPEYGGADPSYQTLCMTYLALIHQMHADPVLLESLGRAVQFVAYFAHPDGSFGGEYGSRNCEIIYPGGLALLSKHFPLAAALTQWAAWSYRESRTVTPLAVDTENLTPVLSNVFLAEQYAVPSSGDRPQEKLPYEQGPFVQDFHEAGIRIVNREHYYAVIGWKKGGVIKAFNKLGKKIILDDCGVVIETSNGRLATTQMLSPLHKADFSAEDIAVASPTFYLAQPVPSPARFLLLRLLNLSLWKIRRLREAGKKLLVFLLIRNGKKCGLRVHREIRFGPESPEVKDRLTSPAGKGKIRAGGKFSSIHMASSRYFFRQ
jgi:hypothetical protein